MYLNFRRAAAVTAAGVAVAGIAGTAYAAAGNDATVSGSPSLATSDHVVSALVADPSTSPKDKGAKNGKDHDRRHGLAALRALKRFDHATVTTTGKDGKSVTHTLFVGTVTAVSPTSVTVQARDKKTQSYAVAKDTKIAVKVKGEKPKAETIAQIAKGDRVFAAGTGTGTVTAQRLLELPKK
ncbi:hypothetical protein [Jatrophihabitans fulvus]